MKCFFPALIAWLLPGVLAVNVLGTACTGDHGREQEGKASSQSRWLMGVNIAYLL